MTDAGPRRDKYDKGGDRALAPKDKKSDVVDYSVTTEQMSKIHEFSGGMFCHTQLNASTKVKLSRLSITINYTKDERR